MGKHFDRLNSFFVGSFNTILRAEEDALAVGEFSDLSVREIHYISAVCDALDVEKDTSSKAIAHELGVTQGTLTTAVRVLEQKGYLRREKRGTDKRQVFLVPTEKGVALAEKHNEFHRNMVREVEKELPEEQLDRLSSALSKLTEFFTRKGE